MKPTFYQRAKDVLTRPITLKGTVALMSRIFKRNTMQEGLMKTPASEQRERNSAPAPTRSVDSGLWEERSVGIRSTSVVKKADSLREKALDLTAQGHEEYADGYNMEAAELYIQTGMLSKAEEIGLEFQERGRYMTAAKILSESGAIPFFELLEYLHQSKLYNMANRILQDFTGPRGLVKYHEMHKPFPPELVHAFSGRELVTYAKKMMLQRKKHHVFQLAEITESASMYSEAAELYGLIGLHKSQAKSEAKALVKEGRYLEAGRHCFSFNLMVEARDIAAEAAGNGELIQAGRLFLELGEKRTARALAARASKKNNPESVRLFNDAFDESEVQLLLSNPNSAGGIIMDGRKSLFKALHYFAHGNMGEAHRLAHRADIVESAFLLFEQGRYQEAYQLAQGMKLLGDNLGSDFCNAIAARVYSQGAVSMMRENSNVIQFPRRAAA